MHEHSLLRSLMSRIDAVAHEHQAQRVRVVRLKLGPLAHVDADHLRQHFVVAARGTVAEHARLEIELTTALHELSLESLDVDDPTSAALQLVVRGRVQGVGFRPFVARLAQRLGLRGQVRNTSEGVAIIVEGDTVVIREFQRQLRDSAPPPVAIESIEARPIAATGCGAMEIGASTSTKTSTKTRTTSARVPADRSICADCQRQVIDHRDRRHAYAFTTCTTCGPRYSVMEALPYDRDATSMRAFTMCAACAAEYASASDRRYHSQSNSCPACGPRIGFWGRHGAVIANDTEAVGAAAAALRRGEIVALKGLGGFQLLVRADRDTAVRRLRERKQRPAKPFAVMLPDMNGLVNLSALERDALQSAATPIVLLDKRCVRAVVAPSVAPGLNTLGVFLPATPLHQLLLDRVGSAVVATSGNRYGEPIVVDERQAVATLGDIADAFLVHERPIVRRVDDSVVRVIGAQPVTLRLARGLAPLALPAIEALAQRYGIAPTLATGAHIKSALALWSGSQAILAPHIGDLDDAPTRLAFEAAATDLTRLYGSAPRRHACDLHPDYFSSRWAQRQGGEVARVQHHHAHALACMAEHGLLDREVLALTWDGTGLGADEELWGGEVLRVGAHGYRRIASLLPFALPGGEAAIRNPRRTAFAALLAVSRQHVMSAARELGLESWQAEAMAAMIERHVHAPPTSSVGRLFDAVAALTLGVGAVSYEGEAACYLESVADPKVTEAYPMPLCQGDVTYLDWRPLLVQVVADIGAQAERSAIAARFHNALAQAAAQVVATQTLPDVVLGGGCFQNRLLCERTAAAIRAQGKRVYTPCAVPPGDGGLAVGQLAAAVLQASEASPWES